MARFSGRQTQFYIDVVYGGAFAAAFGYLLWFGMDARVVAFQGGLILGYFLRVWENMTVYERILEDEVAREAEDRVAEEAQERVAEEVEEQVPGEAEERVAEEVEAQVQPEAEARVAEEVEEQVPSDVDDPLPAETEERVADDVETEVLDRFEEVDEELAAELRERLEREA